jgi:hypothetical protein
MYYKLYNVFYNFVGKTKNKRVKKHTTTKRFEIIEKNIINDVKVINNTVEGAMITLEIVTDIFRDQ